MKGSQRALDCQVLITGGAGFVGVNLAVFLLACGERVRILDSLARPGSGANIDWLRERYADRIDFRQQDVREPSAVAASIHGVEHVVHLAAQVAVTRSLSNPPFDFDVNACGTLNVLEAIRRSSRPPSLLFTSTNKVYGALDDLRTRVDGERHVPVETYVRECGIDETRPLRFHSPYGCSKGAADQYVLDYARSFGLRTVVFRMSCIYGPHQHGNEDQGWVAHMARCALAGEPITIYGDGMQVRDVLFVDDLIDACSRARRHMGKLSGRAFNIGGGPVNAVSLRELIARLERTEGRQIEVSFEDWRVGDQRYYVSDTHAFSDSTGWRAQTSMESGLDALCCWLAGSGMTLRQPRSTAAMRVSMETPR